MNSPSASSTLSALWEKRYRAPAPPVLPDTPVIRVQMAHHSVRDYKPDPLPQGALEAGIAAASSVATSSNLQSWSVVAVENPETRRKLAELCGSQPYIAQAPLFLAWIVDLSRLERMAAREGHESEALTYQESFLMASFDTGLAAQNAVLAFESMGLGTVYIGGLRNNPAEVAALLGLPSRAMAVVGLCVGHPASQAAGDIKPRLGQDVVLHREYYDHSGEAAYIAAYDKRADEYQKEQGLVSRRWSQTAAGRIATAAALGGRHLMRDMLEHLGFHLK